MPKTMTQAVIAYILLAVVLVTPPLWIPAIIAVILLVRRERARRRAWLAGPIASGWTPVDQERFKAARRAL